MTLIYQLHTLKKGSLSMCEHIRKKRSIVDNLLVIAQLVSDSNMASDLLNGLNSDYDAIITCMTSFLYGLEPPSFQNRL